MKSNQRFGPPPGGPCPHGHMYPSSCPQCNYTEVEVSPVKIDCVVVETPEGFATTTAKKLAGADNSERLPRWRPCIQSEYHLVDREGKPVKAQAILKEVTQLKTDLAQTMKAEQLATKALTYLAGKLSTPDKMSPEWIIEAITVCAESEDF